MTPLRIAVVGAGTMGRLHCRVITEHPDAYLAAVVDPVGYPAIVPFHEWHPTLDSMPADVDAVIVAVPTALHEEVALDVIRRGFPVLVEKPLAPTVDAAERIIAAAAIANVPLQVGHVERFNPAVRMLAKALEARRLGTIFQLRAQRLSPHPGRTMGSGVILDLATHDIDVMCSLVGDPFRVSAEAQGTLTREDMIAATLRFENGAIGLLEVNWLTPTKVRRLTVTGEHGMFDVDYLSQQLTLYENGPHRRESWTTLDTFGDVAEGDVTTFAIPRRREPLAAQLDAFIAACRGSEPVAVTGADGLRAIQIALALVESSIIGETVPLATRPAAGLSC